MTGRFSTLLMAGSAVLGLLVAGYGLFTAKGTVMHRVPPEDAALVNARPILMSDFIAQAENTYTMPFAEVSQERRKTVLASMIHEELYVQRGLELDFPGTDPDTRNAVVAAVEQQAVADATTEVPSEAALQSYYAAHQARYASEGTMLLQDFRLTGAAPAADVVEALRRSRASREVIKRYVLEELRPNQGEDFYFAAKIHLGERLFEVARTMGDDAVSDAVSLADGVHILHMIKNNAPAPREYVRARERVLGDYKRDAAARLRAADEKYLYGKADVQIAAELR